MSHGHRLSATFVPLWRTTCVRRLLLPAKERLDNRVGLCRQAIGLFPFSLLGQELRASDQHRILGPMPERGPGILG